MFVPTRQFNEGLIIYIQLFFHTGQGSLAKLSTRLQLDYSYECNRGLFILNMLNFLAF